MTKEKAQIAGMHLERGVRSADEKMGGKYLHLLNKVARIIKRRKDTIDIKDFAQRVPKLPT
jgi:hypothetical protein